LSALAEDAAKLTQLQKVRSDKGDSAQLDVDRSAVEEEKLWSSLAEERAKLAQGLRECGEILGAPCEPFGSEETARAFLSTRPGAPGRLEDRPDLRSLELQKSAAEHNLTLAHWKAMPDPTVRLGYVHDRFVASGNQQNSLFVGVSLPVTVFDHGQADARAALATRTAVERTRDALTLEAHHQLERLEQDAISLEARRKRVTTTTLPLARSVVSRLEEIVKRGGAPLPDLLLARRTLGEVTLDAVDLDLNAFVLSVAQARVLGAGPIPPNSLSPEGPTP
jgi:cobalt-zinc-cadmium efflux system outer membrane protein